MCINTNNSEDLHFKRCVYKINVRPDEISKYRGKYHHAHECVHATYMQRTALKLSHPATSTDTYHKDASLTLHQDQNITISDNILASKRPDAYQVPNANCLTVCALSQFRMGGGGFAGLEALVGQSFV